MRTVVRNIEQSVYNSQHKLLQLDLKHFITVSLKIQSLHYKISSDHTTTPGQLYCERRLNVLSRNKTGSRPMLAGQQL